MNIKQKREAGEVLGRAGIADEIIKICERVAEEKSRKGAVTAAGEIMVLAQSCGYDCYWSEKRDIGVGNRENDFEYMLATISSGGSKSVLI